jgi:hypothetical protein
MPAMRNECILSYWEKKCEDSSYVKGSEPEKTYAWILLRNMMGNKVTIDRIRDFHMVISKVAFLFAVYVLTLNNRCVPKTMGERSKLVAYGVLSGMALRFLCFDSGIVHLMNHDEQSQDSRASRM